MALEHAPQSVLLHVLESRWVHTAIKVVIIEINVDSLVLLRDIVVRLLLDFKFSFGRVERECILDLSQFLLGLFLNCFLMIFLNNFGFFRVHDIIFFEDFSEGQRLVSPLEVEVSGHLLQQDLFLSLLGTSADPASRPCHMASNKFVLHINWWVFPHIGRVRVSHTHCFVYLQIFILLY